MKSRPMVRRMRDLTLLATLACACVLSAYLNVGNTITHSILALPLILFAPGYALVQAASPRHAPDWAEAGALSLGLSLVVCVLGGLALNVTPWGLQTQTEVTLLSAIVLVACAVALARRMRVRDWQAGHDSTRPERAHSRIRWDGVVRFGLFTLAALLIGGAITTAIVDAQQQQTPSAVTQFWALPATDPAQKDTIRLGINSTESSSTTYNVEIIVGEKVTWLPTIQLKPNGSWQSTITLPHWSDGTEPAEILLFRADDLTHAYRQLKLWPDASATSTKTVGK